MDPERTTTIGDGESAMTESPFHIMNAVERMRAKFRSWAAACRGFWRADNIVRLILVMSQRRAWSLQQSGLLKGLIVGAH